MQVEEIEVLCEAVTYFFDDCADGGGVGVLHEDDGERRYWGTRVEGDVAEFEAGVGGEVVVWEGALEGFEVVSEGWVVVVVVRVVVVVVIANAVVGVIVVGIVVVVVGRR